MDLNLIYSSLFFCCCNFFQMYLLCDFSTTTTTTTIFKGKSNCNFYSQNSGHQNKFFVSIKFCSKFYLILFLILFQMQKLCGLKNAE